jgi:hypothetical protein
MRTCRTARGQDDGQRQTEDERTPSVEPRVISLPWDKVFQVTHKSHSFRTLLVRVGLSTWTTFVAIPSRSRIWQQRNFQHMHTDKTIFYIRTRVVVSGSSRVERPAATRVSNPIPPIVWRFADGGWRPIVPDTPSPLPPPLGEGASPMLSALALPLSASEEWLVTTMSSSESSSASTVTDVYGAELIVLGAFAGAVFLVSPSWLRFGRRHTRFEVLNTLCSLKYI